MAEILIACILALGLWILISVGEVSFAHSGFMCIGAYTVAILTVHKGISFWLALSAVGLTTSIVALPIGFIGLKRVRGVYFFMFSLAVGESIRLVSLYWKELTRGVNGISGIPRPKIFQISFSSPLPFYYLCLAILVITVGMMYLMWGSRLGTLLRAVRSSEKLASALGISAFACRMVVWLVCCFIAGVSGGLTASFIGFTSPHEFTVTKTMYPLAHIIIGGYSNPFGPLIGTGLMMLFSTVIRDVAGAPYWVESLTYGTVLLIVMIGLRSSIFEVLSKVAHREGATEK